MKNRGTAALIALFFAGLVGLWLADSLQVPSAAERERQHGRVLTSLTNLKPDDLRRIEIEAKGDTPTLVFERRDGQKWQMTAPLDVAANPSLVEGLAVTLKSLTRKPESAIQTGDPAQYGLAPAERTIRLWGQSTAAPLAVLELGSVNLDRRFVRAGAAGIEVVPAQGLDVVDLPAVRWRDHELFRVPTFEVDAVTVALDRGDLKFRRSRDAWRIVAPIQTLASEARIEGLVANLGSLRITNDNQYVANDVKAADLDRYGLAKPSLRITVSSGRGPETRPPQTLEVGKPVDGQPDRVYARTTDQNDVVSVEARVLNELAKAEPNSFRTEKVADINPNRATKLRVVTRDESFEITRSGNTWYVIRPSVGRADPKAIQEFFQALEGLKTTLYLPPARATDDLAGLSSPQEVIQVWESPTPGVARSEVDPDAASDEQPTFTLRLGNRDVGKHIVYAQTGGDSSVLLLPDPLTTNLFKHSWAFRDRLILGVPTEQLDRIEFEGLGKHVTLHAPVIRFSALKDAAMGWRMIQPVAAPADHAALTKLFKLLEAFRVDGYAAESPPSLSPFGLDEPSLKITWSMPALLPPAPLRAPLPSKRSAENLDAARQTLWIGAPVSDRRSMRYAMLAGTPIVFMIGGENLATLDAEWHDHQVFHFDPAAVEQIHLDWPGSNWKIDLTRTDGGWSVVGPVDVPGFDPTAVGTILGAAADLTTPRYLQYQGEIPPTVGLTPPRLALTFSGTNLARPVRLDLGSLADSTQGCAAAPVEQPGAVFFVKSAPFLPWLKVQPELRDGLPEDVWQREMPNPAAPPDRPGQTAVQP